MIWPLLREWFPCLRSLSTTTGKSGPLQPSYGQNSRGNQINSALRSGNGKDDIALGDFNFQLGTPSEVNTEKRGRHDMFSTWSSSRRRDSPDSDERELQGWGKGDIRAEVTIEVERESTTSEDVGGGALHDSSYVSSPKHNQQQGSPWSVDGRHDRKITIEGAASRC
jgi:hypothetical protein